MQKLFIDIQPFSTNDSPIYLDGRKRVTKEEAILRGIPQLVMSDPSYRLVYKDNNISILKKNNGQLFCYIIFGNVEQKDERGRRMAYSCYAETKSSDIKYVLSEMCESLSVVNHSILMPEFKVTPRNKPSLKCILALIALGAATIFLVYQFAKK